MYVADCLTLATTFSAFGSWSAKKGITTMGFPWYSACGKCMLLHGMHDQHCPWEAWHLAPFLCPPCMQPQCILKAD